MNEVELLERTVCDANSVIGQMVREPGWVQVSLPEAKTDYRNLVLHCVLDESEADARIERTKAHYARLGVDFRWWITPSSRPLDLAQRLERHGLRLADEIAAMVADPDRFPRTSGDGIEVRRVTAKDLDDYADVTAGGWGGPPAARARFRDLARRELESDGARASYLASWRGQPAGTASLAYFDDSAHFSGSVVRAEFRRRGVYRALIDARMAAVRERGQRIVTNLCRAGTSAPICRKLGFRDVCTMTIYSSAGAS